MYFRKTIMPLVRDCSAINRSNTPARAAALISPARSELGLASGGQVAGQHADAEVLGVDAVQLVAGKIEPEA